MTLSPTSPLTVNVILVVDCTHTPYFGHSPWIEGRVIGVKSTGWGDFIQFQSTCCCPRHWDYDDHGVPALGCVFQQKIKFSPSIGFLILFSRGSSLWTHSKINGILWTWGKTEKMTYYAINGLKHDEFTWNHTTCMYVYISFNSVGCIKSIYRSQGTRTRLYIPNKTIKTLIIINN